MSSNYLFAFNRSRLAPAAPAAPVRSARSAPATAKAVTLQDRFSLNRLIHYKATGSCRSCG